MHSKIIIVIVIIITVYGPLLLTVFWTSCYQSPLQYIPHHSVEDYSLPHCDNLCYLLSIFSACLFYYLPSITPNNKHLFQKLIIVIHLRNRAARGRGCVYVLQRFFRPPQRRDNRSRKRLNGFSWNFYQTTAGIMEFSTSYPNEG